MHKRTIAIAIGLLVSAALLSLVFYGIDWKQFFIHLRSLKPLGAVAVVALFFLSLYIRALRWRHLLPSDVKHNTALLFDSLNIGFFASSILPLRAGELLRPLVYSRNNKAVSFSTAFASVITERIFDTLVVLSLFAFVLLSHPQIPPVLLLGAYALGTLAIVLTVIISAIYAFPRIPEQVCSAALSLTKNHHAVSCITTLQKMSVEFSVGLRAISSKKELLLSVIWSIVLWLEIALLYHVGLWAMGINVPFSEAVALSVVIALAVAAPSAPGFVGTFQAGCVLALTTLYGHDQTLAVSYSIAVHGLQFFSTIAIGLISAKRLKLGVRDFAGSQSKIATPQ